MEAFTHNNVCGPMDNQRLRHHTQAVCMSPNLPTDEEAPDSMINTLLEVMGWQPTSDLRTLLEDVLVEDMKQQWQSLTQFNSISGCNVEVCTYISHQLFSPIMEWCGLWV